MRCTRFTPRCLVLPAVVASALLSGCGLFGSTDEPTPQPEVPSMEVTANVTSLHRCSRISPEIQILNPPRDVDYYNVSLVEHGDVDTLLGGGSWTADESGIIPEGALTRHYRGPCPSAGKSRDYSYVVSAMAKANMQPLEVRIYRFTQD